MACSIVHLKDFLVGVSREEEAQGGGGGGGTRSIHDGGVRRIFLG